MRMIGLAVVLAVALNLAPIAAEAQQMQKQKAAKIGFLLGGTASSPAVQIEPFKQTLREKEWIEGQNLTLEYRSANGAYERLPALAADLVGRRVDAIVTDGTPQTQAAQQATKTIPIVMATTGDPVASGLVATLARPGGNTTGASYFVPELNAKRLEILKEAAPDVKRVAVLYNPHNRMDELALEAIEAAAKPLKIRIQRLAVHTPADVEAVFSVMTKRTMDAITIVEDAVIHASALSVVDVALKNRVAALVGLSSLATAGAFMSYGPNRADLWRQAALITDRVLHGATPADLPIEQPTKFELVINVKTAKALGLTIPPSVLLRADSVIE
jgi:putative tryptophan/tyrosine transport system substrate-binding protein